MKGSCIRCALCVSDVTGFGTFDNSTRKRVLDLLEPGDVRLGQVVIERVAVVKLGVNNGSGDDTIQYNIRLLEAVRTQRRTIIEREKYVENENVKTVHNE